jgi:hypothetical protein
MSPGRYVLRGPRQIALAAAGGSGTSLVRQDNEDAQAGLQAGTARTYLYAELDGKPS